MSIMHAINHELRVVLSTWVGEVSDADLEPSYRKLFEDEAWNPGYHGIVDLRYANIRSITSEGLSELYSLIENQAKDMSGQFNSVLVASDETVTQFAKTYEELDKGDDKITVFEDLYEALKWLKNGEH